MEWTELETDLAAVDAKVQVLQNIDAESMNLKNKPAPPLDSRGEGMNANLESCYERTKEVLHPELRYHQWNLQNLCSSQNTTAKGFNSRYKAANACSNNTTGWQLYECMITIKINRALMNFM